MQKALEAAARALCRQAGNPENTKFEGQPMWMSYLPEASAAIQAALPDLMQSVALLIPAEDRATVLRGMAEQAGDPLERLARSYVDCQQRLAAAEARGDERDATELRRLLEDTRQLIARQHAISGRAAN